MTAQKVDIIARLRKEILLQNNLSFVKTKMDAGLGEIAEHFPGCGFPTGAIHEFISTRPADSAASSGFVAGILASLMENKGAIAWIGTSLKLFPPALFSFNIEPSRVLFIDLKREKELLWTMEEALKSEALSAVVGEIPEVSFIASRRLQLAVEKSRVTGFLLRTNPKNLTTTACVTRWQITSLPGDPGEMPGVGFPRWKVKLEKVRNGQPGEWIVEWRPGGFRLIKPSQYVIASLSRKIG